MISLDDAESVDNKVKQKEDRERERERATREKQDDVMVEIN